MGVSERRMGDGKAGPKAYFKLLSYFLSISREYGQDLTDLLFLTPSYILYFPFFFGHCKSSVEKCFVLQTIVES